MELSKLVDNATAGDVDAFTTLVRRYLTQPFHVAEPFTNRPGVNVPRATALADVRALLNGAGDTIPLDSLLMTGSLADITGDV